MNDVARPLCQYCGTAIERELVRCVTCETPHHRECFLEGGACTTFGCGCTSFATDTGTGRLVVQAAPAPPVGAAAYPLDVELRFWADAVLEYVLAGVVASFVGMLALGSVVDSLDTRMLILVLWAGFCTPLPVVLYVSQFLVRKSYRYSALRGRVEICWRLLGHFEVTWGLLAGKGLTGVGLEPGTGHDFIGGQGATRWNLVLHRKGDPPWALPIITAAPETALRSQVDRFREVVSAPEVPSPEGLWLGETYLWALSLAVEGSGLALSTLVLLLAMYAAGKH